MLRCAPAKKKRTMLGEPFEQFGMFCLMFLTLPAWIGNSLTDLKEHLLLKLQAV